MARRGSNGNVPGVGVHLGQKILRRTQPRRGGDPVPKDQNGQGVPEAGGDLFVHAPFFNGFCGPARQLQPVAGLPGTEGEGGQLFPVQPEVRGPLGLAAYLGLLISSAVWMVRRGAGNPYVIAALFAMLCYGAQAVVNINLPIVTPVMWTLMMVGLSGCRGEDGHT